MGITDKYSSSAEDEVFVRSVSRDGSADGIPIEIPDFLFTAEYSRQGSNLVLDGTDGQTLIIEAYFETDNPPDLISEMSPENLPAPKRRAPTHSSAQPTAHFQSAGLKRFPERRPFSDLTVRSKFWPLAPRYFRMMWFRPVQAPGGCCWPSR